MQVVGYIDREIYRCVTENIVTDEVIITEERISHIVKRRGQAFFDEYFPSFLSVLTEPDYIFPDEHKNSALVCKSLEENGVTVNLVLRLAVEGDDPQYKNSIITAIKENDRRFAQRVRNNIPLYKKE